MEPTDDPQVGIHFPDVGDGGGVFGFVGAEHVERQPSRLRLAGDDVKQVGGRDALGQRRRRFEA